MIVQIKQIIYILVTTKKKCNIAVIMDTIQGMHMFKELFIDLLKTVPEWAIPELKLHNSGRMIFGHVTINFILSPDKMRGQRYDIAYISEDVVDRTTLDNMKANTNTIYLL